MSKVSDKQVKDAIDNLPKDGGVIGPFKVYILEKASKSGNVITGYTVEIYKGRRNGSLKLQWERAGKPELPKYELKEEVMKRLQEKTNNSTTCLTSGFNTAKGEGMAKAEEVVLLIKLLDDVGITIELTPNKL